MAKTELDGFRVGDKALFGRQNGSQSQVEVTKLRRSKIVVTLLEPHNKWGKGARVIVPTSMLTKITGTRVIPGQGEVYVIDRDAGKGGRDRRDERRSNNKEKRADNRTQETFNKVADKFGVPRDVYGKTINLNGSRLKVVGAKPRATKNAFLVTGTRGGGYVVSKRQLLQGMAAVGLSTMGGGRAPAKTPAKQKRSENEILRDMQSVETNLSPENLTCDGELPAYQWKKKRAALNRKMKALVVELGRKPTDRELWGY